MSSDLTRLLHLRSISPDDPIVNKELVSYHLRHSLYSDLFQIFMVSSESSKKQKIFFRDLIIQIILDGNVHVTWNFYTLPPPTPPLDLPSTLSTHIEYLASNSHQRLADNSLSFNVSKTFSSIVIDSFYIPTYSFFLPHLFADLYRLLLVTHLPVQHPYFPTAHKLIQALYLTPASFALIASSLSPPSFTTSDYIGFDRIYQFLMLLHAHLGFYLTNSSFFFQNCVVMLNSLSAEWLTPYQISRILLSRYFSFSDIKFAESLDPLP